MSKEKGTTAQNGTGGRIPYVQKCHRTGEGNVKIKLNASGAKALFRHAPQFLKARMTAKLGSVLHG